MILGGGLAVMVLGPLDVGPENAWLNPIVKAVAAVLMVVLWVWVLVRMMRYILRR
jgi:flagellar biogenesis protein FliO